jgi:hypothetical protein
MEANSLRREQVKDHLRASGLDGPAAAQIAAHRTRDSKNCYRRKKCCGSIGSLRRSTATKRIEWLPRRGSRPATRIQSRQSRPGVRDLCPRSPLRAFGGRERTLDYDGGARQEHGRGELRPGPAGVRPAESRRASSAPSSMDPNTRASSTPPRPCCAWSARPSARCRKATGAATAIRCWLREEIRIETEDRHPEAECRTAPGGR